MPVPWMLVLILAILCVYFALQWLAAEEEIQAQKRRADEAWEAYFSKVDPTKEW